MNPTEKLQQQGTMSIKVPAPARAYVYLMLLLLVAAGLLIGRHIERIELAAALQAQREETVREASLLASRIEAETNSTFYLIVGLARLIEINGGISEEHYREICIQLVRSRPGLLNIAAAPDMVVRYIYPLEGNEAAMGLDYNTHPTQKEAAFQVKETGQPVIAGPLTLVQGGEAVIGRFPVYLREADGTRSFWGIISTPFDTSVLYREVGLLDPALGIEVSLRGRDSKGADGEIFFGPADIYLNMPVRFPIQLLSGSWEIAAQPKAGWLSTSPNAGYIRLSVGFVTLLLGLVVWLVYLYLLRLQRSQKAELEAVLVKQRFYANMSHELRTPLNGICGISELIGVSSQDPEIKENAGIILRSAQTLTRLLDDVLLLSRPEKIESSRETIELAPFLSEIFQPLIYETERKQLTFLMEPIPEACAVIRSNASMLRQILWNLLSNAVKFTHSGAVSLSVQAAEDGAVSFIVNDTGIGIAEDFLGSIFKDFVQEDVGLNRRYEGAGLGLAVVRRFVASLGGTISVKSEQGQGSEFTVTLPQ